jgi:hypothetical protein
MHRVDLPLEKPRERTQLSSELRSTAAWAQSSCLRFHLSSQALKDDFTRFFVELYYSDCMYVVQLAENRLTRLQCGII